MSAIKKAKAFLVTTCAKTRVDDDGSVDVEDVHQHVSPVTVEYLDESAGEVVYDAGKASGKSKVGYSKVYAESWERTFGGDRKDSLPN